MYVYRQVNTGESSTRFGNCEICDQFVNNVIHQIEGRIYQNPETELDAVTYHECHNIFGHQNCLNGAQRTG